MRIPKRAAVILTGVFLAGSVAALSDAARAAPKALPAVTVPSPPAAEQPPAEPRGRVYLFRGALGPIFSLGMDHLAERIRQAGFTASVDEFTICNFVADRAIREYRQDPAPISLIGHSMGGLCAVNFAEKLDAEHIPVSLVVTVDPAHVTPDVPMNVERFINVFRSTDILGGGDVKPKQGFPGHYASIDLSQHPEVTHINIDKMDAIHDQLIAKIQQLAATSGKTEGDTTPIRVVVPPDAPIELWDSGMPVFARPGDTLDALAALYHVPKWSLLQVNKGVVDGAPLIPGERIVVPRHLVPALAAAPGPSTPLRH